MFHLPKDERKSAVVAGTVGNIIEWYDFALYGYMASILSTLFFPEGSKTASLLATYGIFAAGFLMRPLGSGLFGWFGDTFGRSTTMLVSVMLMALPTFLIGVLPTYAQAGLWAPALLVAIRLVQGLSVGGEFSSSVTYLVETAPSGKRGQSGSWANVGSLIGMLLGSGAASLVTSVFAHDVVRDWGWRLPFLAGGVLGIVAIYLRRNIRESKHFKKHERQHGEISPLKQAFTENRLEMVQGTLFASAYGALFYLALVYMPTWLEKYANVPLQESMRFNTLATALVVPLIPLAGWISDRFVRRRTMILMAVSILAVSAYPLYAWVNADGAVAGLVAQIALAVFIAVAIGTGPAFFAELFPTRDRLSGYSITYNLGLGVVGGATPMMVTWLISVTGEPLMVAAFAVGIGALGAGALLTIKDRSREPLR